MLILYTSTLLIIPEFYRDHLLGLGNALLLFYRLNKIQCKCETLTFNKHFYSSPSVRYSKGLQQQDSKRSAVSAL